MTKAVLSLGRGLAPGLLALASAAAVGPLQPLRAQPAPVSEIRMRLQSAQVGAEEEITLRADGSATYVTRRGYPKRKVAKRTSQLSRGTFERLVALLEQGGLEQLSDRYESTRTHETRYTVVIKRGDQEKAITDYGQVGPPALWGFELVVERLIDRSEWR